MNQMRNLICILSLAMLTISAQALVLTSGSRQVNLLQEVQYFEDPSGQLSVQEARNMDSRFQSWTRGGVEMSFGMTSSAYWFRVPLARLKTAPVDWLLELPSARINEVDFYSPDGLVIRTGRDRPFSSRPYFDRFFVFPVQVDTVAGDIYIRVRSNYSLAVPLWLWQTDAYRQHQHRSHALQFMFFGAVVLLAIYGLVIYLSLRDCRFLIYSSYIVVAGLAIVAKSGYGRQMLWTDAPVFDNVAQNVFFSAAGYFAVLFVRRLLLAPDDHSWIAQFLRGSQTLFLITTVLTLLVMAYPALHRSAYLLQMLNGVSMGLLVNYVGLRAWRENRPGARYFFAGWAALWMGVCISVLRAMNLIPSTGLTTHAMQIFMGIEMLMMALAMGDLLRLENASHIHTQEQALVAKQALLDMSRTSEENLRKTVQERTVQLDASLRLEKSLRAQYVRLGSMISDEFRGLLNIILTEVRLMRQEHEREIDQVVRRLSVIASATHKLKSMFDQWLHSDAFNETMDVSNFRNFELQTWLIPKVQVYLDLQQTHQVDLQLDSPQTQVLADDYYLNLALSNLIDNAIRLSPIDSKITIDLRHKPRYVGIAVTNQCQGSLPKMQVNVFDNDPLIASGQQIRGAGLGLFIVQRIARAHRGHLEFITIPGPGTTFCLWLPTT